MNIVLVFDFIGYYDFSWLYNFACINNWFVTPEKDNLDNDVAENFDVIHEKDKDVLQDCNIRWNGNKNSVNNKHSHVVVAQPARSYDGTDI